MESQLSIALLMRVKVSKYIVTKYRFMFGGNIETDFTTRPISDTIHFCLLGNRVHVYDSNFFKALYHCKGEREKHADDSNAGNAAVDAAFQSGGGLWSGICGSANEIDANKFTIPNSNQLNRIVGGNETAKHQYPWMVS